MAAVPVAALTAMAALLGACASTHAPDLHGLDPANAALVDRTCREVLGLQPGEVHFDGCAETLADSLRRDSAARAARAAPPDEAAAPPYLSYFSMSPAQKHERERLACTRLGLEDAGGVDATCIASLDSRFFGLDHPLD